MDSFFRFGKELVDQPGIDSQSRREDLDRHRFVHQRVPTPVERTERRLAEQRVNAVFVRDGISDNFVVHQQLERVKRGVVARFSTRGSTGSNILSRDCARQLTLMDWAVGSKPA
jgi:hypothetical protein